MRLSLEVLLLPSGVCEAKEDDDNFEPALEDLLQSEDSYLPGMQEEGHCSRVLHKPCIHKGLPVGGNRHHAKEGKPFFVHVHAGPVEGRIHRGRACEMSEVLESFQEQRHEQLSQGNQDIFTENSQRLEDCF